MGSDPGVFLTSQRSVRKSSISNESTFCKKIVRGSDPNASAISAEWSKKLFTIIHYELQNSRCIVTQELRAYIFSDNSSNFVHIVFVGSDPGYFTDGIH